MTPRLIDSICTSENRLLPLLAPPVPRSFSVSVFIAVNCIELKPPNSARCTTFTQTGTVSRISAKLAIITPTMIVFASSTLR